MSATVSEVERYIRDGSNELVTTHVFHVVDEEISGDAVRTECGYCLFSGQYDDRKHFDETLTTANQICHHCERAIRGELEGEQ